jgi:hypothetical protein
MMLERHHGEISRQSTENIAYELHLLLAGEVHSWNEGQIPRIIAAQKVSWVKNY